MARISGVDIPREKRVEVALTYIYGIGLPTSQKILQQTNVNPDTRVRDLTEDQVTRLRELIGTAEEPVYVMMLEAATTPRRQASAPARAAAEVSAFGATSAIWRRRSMTCFTLRTKSPPVISSSSRMSARSSPRAHA